MAFTVQNIADEALQLIGILVPGRGANPAEYQAVLDALNQIVDAFSADGLTIYQMVREVFVLTGMPSYTIGASATFNTTRPEKIRAAAVISTNGSMPCQVVSAEKFSSIIDRSATGAFADFVCCDYDFPISTIYLWPAPASGSLELWSYKPLTGFVALTDTVNFPPGYLECLKFNLAVVIAPMFPGARLAQTIPAKAQMAKASLGALNAVTIGNPAPPMTPVPLQQPLTAVDIEKGKAVA